jgi:hypothetical protein
VRAEEAARLAAAAAGRTVMFKVGLWVLVAFIAILIVAGGIVGGGASSAFAASCGGVGTPSVVEDSGALSAARRAQQIDNARTIDRAAQSGGLSGQATLIGLMTALQESTLIEPKGGDRDSRGIFQQRPSAGWGTVAEVSNPEYAAHAFFFGVHPLHGPQVNGLVDIPGWQTMPLGQAAQAVQHSAFPTLYAGQEAEARKIADEAGIDLTRAGTSGADATPGSEPGTSGTCYVRTTPGAAAAFHDGSANWPDVVANPRSTASAIAWAEEQAAAGTGGWFRSCLRFVAEAYGWHGAGVTYAIDAYTSMPASMRHDHDRDPPPGALMFWDTHERAGHVALYLGDGLVASNDIARPNYIAVVRATEIETKWGADYLGWAPPYFPKGF